MAENPSIVVKVDMSCEIRGAEKIISGIRARGFAVELTQDGGLAVTPASQLQPYDREVIRTNKAAIVDYLTAANDPHAPDLTATAQDAPPVQPAINVGTSRPPGLTPALLAASLALDAKIAASGVETGDPDAYCWPNGTAANGQELGTMSRRLEQFKRLGLDVDDAERLTGKLLARDREGDDRHACLECSGLSGGSGGWRCMSFRARGATDPGLPRDLVQMLARCQVFVAGQPSIGVFTAAMPANEPRLAQRERTPGPWLNASESSAALEYHRHHAQCPQCQAAGRGYRNHCSEGAILWSKYQLEDGEND